MTFVTVDPEAIYDADIALNAIMGRVEEYCVNHQRRANLVQNSIEELRGKHLSGFESWQIEQLWDTLNFRMLNNEFNIARDDVRELLDQARKVFAILAQRHNGILSERILELGDPLAITFNNIANPLSDLTGWLTFDNIWGIIERPWAIIDLLAAVTSYFSEELQQIPAVRAVLARLRQRALLLIEELEHPLISALESESVQQVADELGTFLTAGGLVVDIVKDGGSLSKLLKASPDVGPLDVLGDILSFIADKDHSPHSIGAHVYGSLFQIAASFIPGEKLVDGGMAVTAFESTMLATIFDAAGQVEGGRWGAAYQTVGAQWSQTSKDASAFDKTFTDLGALALDMHAGTIGAMLSPELAPFAPFIFQAENAAGSNTANLGGDESNLWNDVGDVMSVPFDVAQSGFDSTVAVLGNGAHSLVNATVPAGARQTVDNALYDGTSALMKIGSFL